MRKGRAIADHGNAVSGRSMLDQFLIDFLAAKEWRSRRESRTRTRPPDISQFRFGRNPTQRDANASVGKAN
jgi:hypothetical protein